MQSRDGNLPEPDGENPENRGRGPGPGIPGIAKPGPGPVYLSRIYMYICIFYLFVKTMSIY